MCKIYQKKNTSTLITYNSVTRASNIDILSKQYRGKVTQVMVHLLNSKQAIIYDIVQPSVYQLATQPAS